MILAKSPWPTAVRKIGLTASTLLRLVSGHSAPCFHATRYRGPGPGPGRGEAAGEKSGGALGGNVGLDPGRDVLMSKVFPKLSVTVRAPWEVRQDGFRGSQLPTQLGLLPFLVTPFPPTPIHGGMYPVFESPTEVETEVRSPRRPGKGRSQARGA